MNALTSPQAYTAMALVQLTDASLCVKPRRFVTECLDDVGLPNRIRWILPVIKAASAFGLGSVWRLPRLARCTAVLLTVYFALAVGAHVRVRDFGRNFASATALLAVYGTLAGKGPSVSR